MLRIFFRAISTNVAKQQRRRATKPFRESHKLPANVGIRHRLHAMEEDGDDIAIGPDMDIYEDMESDFSQVHKSHKEHEEELIQRNELLKRRIVSQKYFNDYSPNFLTWSEKEHIRHLHATSPQEWTPERLANSFPVTVAGVKKIIKVVWKPASHSRINRHDASALRNWKELKEDTIEDMTPEMKAHVIKFTHRVIPPRSQVVTKESLLIEMNTNEIAGEFGSIVSGHCEFSNINNANSRLSDKKNSKFLPNDYEKNKEDPKTENSSNLIVSSNSSDVRGKEKTTLSHLRANIVNSSKSVDLSLLEKMIISPLIVKKVANDNEKMETLPPIHQIKPNVHSVQNYQPADAIDHVFVEKIKIPPKAWKKGRTYKVDDCYYDDDGSFLYRVPGMTDSVK